MQFPCVSHGVAFFTVTVWGGLCEPLFLLAVSVLVHSGS